MNEVIVEFILLIELIGHISLNWMNSNMLEISFEELVLMSVIIMCICIQYATKQRVHEKCSLLSIIK